MSKKPTAIVIDDDTDVVSVFCEYLDILGIRVVGYGSNGKDAIEVYQQKNPDIVFLDLIMPQYDGYFALEQIKATDPQAKIVMMTSNSSQEVIDKLRRLGSSRIISKPFDADKIIDVVEEISNQKTNLADPKEAMIGPEISG